MTTMDHPNRASKVLPQIHQTRETEVNYHYSILMMIAIIFSILHVCLFQDPSRVSAGELSYSTN